MLNLIPIITTAIIIFFSEIGDKTNLIALTLMGKTKRPFLVMLSSLIGIGLVTLLGVLVGEIAARLFNPSIIAIISGVIFIGFGYFGLKKQNGDEINIDPNSWSIQKIFWRSMLLVGFGEIGDKSQIFVISQSSIQGALPAFLGAIIAFTLIFLLTAIFGQQLIKRIPKDKLLKGVSIIFIILGMYQIFIGILSYGIL